jgi:hypothetical protein
VAGGGVVQNENGPAVSCRPDCFFATRYPLPATRPRPSRRAIHPLRLAHTARKISGRTATGFAAGAVPAGRLTDDATRVASSVSRPAGTAPAAKPVAVLPLIFRAVWASLSGWIARLLGRGRVAGSG